MKLLLDTQCWLWWFAQPEQLSETVIDQIANEANEVWLSVASVWEIGIKYAIGKLLLPEPPETYFSSRMQQLEARSLEITAAHAIRAAALPPHHKDPFDRMIIAQAQIESMVIITSDSAFKRYEVSILKAAKS